MLISLEIILDTPPLFYTSIAIDSPFKRTMGVADQDAFLPRFETETMAQFLKAVLALRLCIARCFFLHGKTDLGFCLSFKELFYRFKDDLKLLVILFFHSLDFFLKILMC